MHTFLFVLYFFRVLHNIYRTEKWNRAATSTDGENMAACVSSTPFPAKYNVKKLCLFTFVSVVNVNFQ